MIYPTTFETPTPAHVLCREVAAGRPCSVRPSLRPVRAPHILDRAIAPPNLTRGGQGVAER